MDKKIDRKPIKIFGAELAYLLLIMLVGAMLGWVAENFYRMVDIHVIDNRYHFLPFIFAYELAVLAMHIALGNPDDIHFFGKKILPKACKCKKLISNVLYLVIVMAFVFMGEILVGSLYESLTGLVIWDYSQMPFHVTKYTGLISAVGFGICAWAFMKFLFVGLLKLLRKRMPLKVAWAINLTLGLLVFLDGVIMLIFALVFKTKPIYWTIKF